MTDNGKEAPDNGRDAAGHFTSSNPGRPRGSRNKSTQALRELMDGQAEELTQAVISAALAGDVGAARICLDRLWPVPKAVRAPVDLPELASATSDTERVNVILGAIGRGELAPDVGAEMVATIADAVHARQLVDLEARIARLEARRDAGEL